jgi:hypothetical protein
MARFYAESPRQSRPARQEQSPESARQRVLLGPVARHVAALAALVSLLRDALAREDRHAITAASQQLCAGVSELFRAPSLQVLRRATWVVPCGRRTH